MVTVKIIKIDEKGRIDASIKALLPKPEKLEDGENGGEPAANGFAVRGLDFSPVKGPEGNIEYLMFVQKSEEPCVLDDAAAEQVVAASHSTLDR